MIRRACYMMSYVAFESFNAFSFLSRFPYVPDFPQFSRVLFRTKRAIRYIYGNNRQLEITLNTMFWSGRSKFLTYPRNFKIPNEICSRSSVQFCSQFLGKRIFACVKKKILQKIMEMLWIKKCIKNYKSFFKNSTFQQNFRSTAFTTINGVYCARRNDTVSFLDQ